ncbi:hypothetical protein RX330_12255 [Bradyrhizobium sp. NDS-1]|nr:hypothetical protein [Bradyrhizobium sp. NDS-1]WOH75786.1 hypothetical protein RX330_12255 [Bradyrhizobium sp. NDS-1]
MLGQLTDNQLYRFDQAVDSAGRFRRRLCFMALPTVRGFERIDVSLAG